MWVPHTTHPNKNLRDKDDIELLRMTPRRLTWGRLKKYELEVEIFGLYRFATKKKEFGFMTSKL